MNKQSGFTLMEMMAVLGIATILSGMAVLNLKRFDQASVNAANQVVALVKSARAYAMTSTVTVQVRPVNSTTIRATAASSCSTTTRTAIPQLSYTLPDGASMTNTSWSVCYTSRGLSRESISIPIRDQSRTRTVQIVLGGGIRTL